MAPLIFLLTSDALQPLQLVTEPVGWEAMKELLARDPLRHGMALSVSVELTFVQQAAAYLRLVYEGGADANGQLLPPRGVEGVVNLTVYEQNPNEFRAEECYRGRLDFTTYVSGERGVSAKFKESGLATQLLTREDTAVDLLGATSLSGAALPAYPPQLTALHSQQLRQRFEMRQAMPNPRPTAGIVTSTDDKTLSQLLFFGMDEPLYNELNVDAFPFGPITGDARSDKVIPFYTAKASGPHTLSFQLATTVIVHQLADGYWQALDIAYYFRHNDDPPVRLAGANLTGPAARGVGETAPAGVPAIDPTGYVKYAVLPVPLTTYTDLALRPGDRLYLYGEVYVHVWSGNTYTAEVSCQIGAGSFIRLTAQTSTPASTCYGLLVHEALARCCEAVADQRGAFYSDYFGRPDCPGYTYPATGPGARRLVTTGFQLRGFPLPSAPAPPLATDPDPRRSLHLSLRTLYQGLDATDCLGLGLEQRQGRPVVRIEPRRYFYQDREVLTLAGVTDLKKAPYLPGLHNAVDVGYEHWQSGAANGLDEFNARRAYVLPLTQVKATYSIVSPLNTAGYLIEEARRDAYAAGAAKEGKADAEPFLVCVIQPAPGTVQSERASACAVPGTLGGILSGDTSYNLRLSPGRLLRAHGAWLRAGLAPQAASGQRLLPGQAQGNQHLRSQLVGEAAPLVEDVAVAIAELPAPWLLAETYEFTCRLRRGEMAALKHNPYGRVSFLDAAGTRKSGYLLKAERTYGTGLTTFTLLRSAT